MCFAIADDLLDLTDSFWDVRCKGEGEGREGGGQDQARKEVVQEVVKWLKAQVTKPDSLASVPKL